MTIRSNGYKSHIGSGKKGQNKLRFPSSLKERIDKQENEREEMIKRLKEEISAQQEFYARSSERSEKIEALENIIELTYKLEDLQYDTSEEIEWLKAKWFDEYNLSIIDEEIRDIFLKTVGPEVLDRIVGMVIKDDSNARFTEFSEGDLRDASYRFDIGFIPLLAELVKEHEDLHRKVAVVLEEYVLRGKPSETYEFVKILDEQNLKSILSRVNFEELEKIVDNSNKSEASAKSSFALAILNQAKGNNDRAVEYFVLAVKCYVSSGKSWWDWQLRDEFIRDISNSNRYKVALELRELAKEWTFSKSEEMIWTLHYVVGLLFKESGYLREATKSFKEFIKNYDLGYSYRDMFLKGIQDPHKPEVATQLVDFTKKLDPKNGDEWWLSAEFYEAASAILKEAGDYEGATELYVQAIKSYAFTRSSDWIIPVLNGISDSIKSGVVNKLINHINELEDDEDPDHVGKLNYMVGKLLSKSTNDDSHRKYFARALENCVKAGDLNCVNQIFEDGFIFDKDSIVRMIDFDYLEKYLKEKAENKNIDASQIAKGFYSLAVVYSRFETNQLEDSSSEDINRFNNQKLEEYLAKALENYAKVGDLDSVNEILDQFDIDMDSVVERINFHSIEEYIKGDIEREKKTSRIANRSYALGILYQMAGEYEKSAEHFAKALEFYAMKGDLRLIREAIYKIDRKNQRPTAERINLSNIENFINKDIKKDGPNSFKVNKKFHILGILYQMAGMDKESVDYFVKVLIRAFRGEYFLTVRSVINDISEANRKSVAKRVAVEVERYVNEWIEKENVDLSFIAKRSYALGVLYQIADESKKSVEYFARALKIYATEGNLLLLNNMINNLDEVYRRPAVERAVIEINRSVNEYTTKENVDLSSIARKSYTLGILYKIAGEYERSAENFAKMLEIHAITGDLSSFNKALEDISINRSIAEKVDFSNIEESIQKDIEKDRDPILIANKSHILAILYQLVGNNAAAKHFALAIRYYTVAVYQANWKSGQKQRREKVLGGISNSNKLKVAQELKKLAGELETFAKYSRDWESIEILYYEAGLLFQESGNVDEAAESFASAVNSCIYRSSGLGWRYFLEEIPDSYKPKVAAKLADLAKKWEIKETQNWKPAMNLHYAAGLLFQDANMNDEAAKQFALTILIYARTSPEIWVNILDDISNKSKIALELADLPEKWDIDHWSAGTLYYAASLLSRRVSEKDYKAYLAKALKNYAKAGDLDLFYKILNSIKSNKYSIVEMIDFDDVEEYIKLEARGENKNPSITAKRSHAIGILYQIVGENEKSAEHFARVLEFHILNGDLSSYKEVLEKISVINRRSTAKKVNLSNIEKIIDEELKRQDTDLFLIAKKSHALGILYQIAGESEKSMKFFAKALEFYTIRGDISSFEEVIEDISRINKVLVVERVNFNDIENSIYEEIKRGITDFSQIAKRSHALGVLYQIVGEDKKSAEYFAKALENYAKIGDVEIVEEILKSLDNQLPLVLSKVNYNSIYEHAKETQIAEIYRSFFVILLNSPVNTPIKNPTNILEYLINDAKLRKFASEIFNLYTDEFYALLSTEITDDSLIENISHLQQILPEITPYERLGLIKLASIDLENVPENLEKYEFLLEKKSREYGIKIPSMTTLLMLEKASKDQIEALKLTHPLLYDSSLKTQKEVLDTSIPLNMQTASDKVKERYKRLSTSAISNINVGKGLSLLYSIVGEEGFLKMGDEELRVSGEFLTHLDIIKKEKKSRFDSKPLLISYILRRTDLDNENISSEMEQFLNLTLGQFKMSHTLFAYHGTSAFEGPFEYRGLPLWNELSPGFYSGSYSVAERYGKNIHLLLNMLSSYVGIYPHSGPIQRRDDLEKERSLSDIYLSNPSETTLIDSLGGVTTLPHNFLIPLSNHRQVYYLLKKFNELARRTESELKREVLKLYKIDPQTFEDISALHSEMLNLGYSEAISLDLAYSLLEEITQPNKSKFMNIFKSMIRISSKVKSFGPFRPIDVSYLVSFYVIKNEFTQKGKVLTHRFPTYIEYGDEQYQMHKLDKGIKLYHTTEINIDKIEDIDTLKEFLDNLYSESYQHYSQYSQSGFKYSLTGDPRKVFVDIWRNIWKINGSYVDEVAKASGEHKPFIESNVPLACGSAGRHEMVPGSSDFELGSIVIEGKSNKAVSAASSAIEDLHIEISSAVSVSYDPNTKEIHYPEDEAYLYAELLDAVPLIDINNSEQRRLAREFRIKLLDKLAWDDKVLNALKTEMGEKHFTEKVMRGHLRIADISSQSVFKHTLYRFAVRLPKIMFIEYYRSDPKFRDYIQKRIYKDPMVSLFSYKEIGSWMKVGSGEDKFPTPLWLGEVILTSRALMHQFWKGINSEYELSASIISPTYIGWLIPPNFQSTLNLLIKETVHQYSEVAKAYLSLVSLEKPKVLGII